MRSTVARSFTFAESTFTEAKTNEPTKINPQEPYQLFIYNEKCEVEADHPAQLNPVFESFVKDGESWASKADSESKAAVTSVLEDYMIMRRAAREETHILDLNRVGIERDDKQLRDNVAKHVGLQMPKLYEGK